MSNINDKATVSLFVNGEQAEAAMDRLKKKASDLDKQLQTAMAAGDKKSANKLQRELDKVNKELNKTESAAKGTGVVLDNLSNSSIHGLRNALKYLEKELRMTKPDSDAWRRYAAQIDQVKSRIAELNEELEGGESAWSKFKNWSVSAWPAIDLIKQGYNQVVDFMRENVDAYASMDQEMANVRKFTGMTAEEVDALNEEFKKMDTRTSREGLNQLAQEAGRLGKTSQEDVLGFVRAADQINVALDDLGEGATLTLSKLTGIFGDEEKYGTEKSLLKVGSVINELSQNCSASAPYLAEFASRMGGVGAQAGMTVSQIMGFAAVLDSNNQNLEASSTALSQVLVRMMQDPAKYAKVAGLEVKKFSTMLKEDANGALIMFLEALNKAGGMDVLSPMFKDMDENGARAISALSTLATHIDQVKAQQEAANIAFEEGTSVTKEFDVQNNTVQASLDKAKKEFQELRIELGERLYPLMGHLLSSTSAIVRAVFTLIDFVSKHKAAVASLTAAIVGYTIAAKSALIVDKAFNALAIIRISLTKIQTAASANLAVVTDGLRLAYFKLTGQTKKAIVAQKSFSAAMATTPWGAILTAITSAVVAFKMFDDKVEETKEIHSGMDQVYAKAEATLKDEEFQLKRNIKTIQTFNGTKDEETKLINDLNSKYGPILGTYSTLSDWMKTLTARGNEYCQSLHDQIVMEGKLEEARALIAKAVELRTSGDGTSIDIGTSIPEMLKRNLGEAWNGNMNVLYNPYTIEDINLEKVNDYWDTMFARAAEYEKQAESLREEAYEMAEKLRPLTPQVTISDDPDPKSIPHGYVSEKTAEKERKKREREAKRAAVKAKQEFKQELNAICAARIAADAEVEHEYRIGNKTYLELTAERHENEVKCYDDLIKVYKKYFADKQDLSMEDDKDYQALLAKRADAEAKYDEKRISLSVETIKRRQKIEELEANARYNSKQDRTIADEIALQEELLKIRTESLQDQMALYKAGSKEYEQLWQQINDLVTQAAYDKYKRYEEAVAKLREQYAKKSVAEQYRLELAGLNALYEAHQIKEEEYQEFLLALRKKYAKLLPENNNEESGRSWTTSDQDKYDKDKSETQEAYDSGLIDEDEYRSRMAKLNSRIHSAVGDALTGNGNEWVRMFGQVYTAFTAFADGMGKTTEEKLGKISNLIAATSAVVTAGFQLAADFAKAEADIQLAALEKRYNRELSLAEGNNYKIKKLEKQKEADTAKIKKEANRKQFSVQVINAIAQSVVAGLNAYASTLAIPVVGPALAPAAMAVALATGAVQVALLKKQQKASEAQGYSSGGFTKPGAVNEPAGIVHAGEWVASQKLLANPVARPMIEALDYAQRTNTIGALKAEDVSRSITAPMVIASQTDKLPKIIQQQSSTPIVVEQNGEYAGTMKRLADRLNEPFVTVVTVTGDQGINKAQAEYNRLMKNKSSKFKK